MKRILLATVGTGCLAALIAVVGCSKHDEAPRQVLAPSEEPDPNRDSRPPVVIPTECVLPGVDPQARALDTLVTRIVEPTNQDRYDAALADAIDRLADRQYGPALAALKAAQQAQDNEVVRREIAKVSELIRQQQEAEQTARDVQTVLSDGRPEEAAELSKQALAQFGGGGDITDNFAQQKHQADALVAATLPTDDDRFARFRADGADARAANNLRAAALSYEQALRFRDDADVRRQYESVQAVLTRYDAGLRRAAGLRRDPPALEDALAALDDARQAWDTPQVRALTDEYTFALQRRRDRVSVAEFEVRGDAGFREAVNGAGRTVAEKLLPSFRPRFDIVEREQVGRILDELKLEAGELVVSPDGQREVGRLARVRYLVVGSISPLNGVTASARLVNVQTGVIEQTARVSAPTVEALIPRLRTLAQMLQMTDEQKFAFEQALADQGTQQTEAVIQAVDLDRLPPAPPLPEPDVSPPPALIIYAPPPPRFFVGVEIDLFRRIPLAISRDVAPPPAAEVVLERRDPRRGRLLALSLELGDNLFRRGQYREAQRHFSVALNLSDGNADVALRVERCRPLVPPMVDVSRYTFRPRLVVFSFLLNTPPGLVPPNLGDWASDQFAAYFGPSYEIVDRGEVCWYMGRLGITFRDVLTDPGARVALAQAMNARYYCFGTVVPTASLDVEAHLMDANTGTRTATGRIHVQDHTEMKLRLGELAAQIGAPGPGAALAIKVRGAASEKALNESRALLKAGKPAEAKTVAERGLTQDPDSAALRTMVADADVRLKQTQIEEQRKVAEAARLKAETDVKARNAQLAHAAEAARLKAEAAAKLRTDADRKAEEVRKAEAARQLEEAGNRAFAGGSFSLAVGDYQSAAALRPSKELDQQIALAKTRLAEAARAQADTEARKRAEAEKKARDAAVVRVEEEKTRRAADEKLKQEARAKEVAGLVSTGRQQLAAKQYGKALASAQAADQLGHSLETEKLLADIRNNQTLAMARDDDARRATEKKLAAEKAIHEKYVVQIELADDGVKAGRYDDAIRAATDALQLVPNDPAGLAVLRKAQDARSQASAQGSKRKADFQTALQSARTALAARRFDDAVRSADDALKLAPGDPNAAAVLRDAKAGKTALEAEDRKKAAYTTDVQSARTALTARRYDAAAKAANDALKLFPNDPVALNIIHQAQDDKARGDLEAKRKADYTAHMQAARTAVTARRYDEAVKAATDALKLFPGDPAATSIVKEAQDDKARGDAETKRKSDYNAQMVLGRQATAAKRYADAVRAYTEALRLVPGDVSATKGLADARAFDRPLAPPAPDYNKSVQNAVSFERQQQLPEAAAAFRDALKVKPGDPRATFGLDLVEGQRALDARRYGDAQKWFEDALRYFPTDADAKALLKRAKDMR